MKDESNQTAQSEFNRIKNIIENEDNNHTHLKPIRNMIDTYREKYGVTGLYNKLIELQTELIKKV